LTFFIPFSGIIDNISCSLGYGNYPAGYPSEHSGYGYGGQASTPGSIPGYPTPIAAQPAPVTGLEIFIFFFESKIFL
jgi:hypothetical protein